MASKVFMTSSLWITEDGTYGTNDVLLIDTSDWEEQDFADIEEASDNDRYLTAIWILSKKGKENGYF